MRVVITGGAGFIGSNVADRHLKDGDDVLVLDNLSREGAGGNIGWLRERHGERVHVVHGDVREFDSLLAAFSDGADRVYHLAAQVAVTTSIEDPREDFLVNSLGTLNVLEAVRGWAPRAVLLYASTNKVYGGMEASPVVEGETRYVFAAGDGITETEPLDFHSPYGCSKGAGDQYVRDYARIYGLRTVVFRQSCIYGTRQFGMEDQGWLAHFCIAARLGRPITIYGDGRQVRDVLWIDDLVDAYERAATNIGRTAGEIYNIGGGPRNTVSVWGEFGPMLQRLAGTSIDVRFEDPRPGDQLVYISDIGKAARDFGWQPRVSIQQGLKRLWRWVDQNHELFVAKVG